MACTRRELLRWAAALPACGVLPAAIADQVGVPQLPEKTGWAEHVPVRWVEPVRRRSGSSAVIWLSGFSDTAESMSPYLQELARAGFLAVSFDHWQHGRRGSSRNNFEQVSQPPEQAWILIAFVPPRPRPAEDPDSP